jgi:ABC-2 type transport system permease protein
MTTVELSSNRVAVGQIFLRTCAAEWTRLWTVKATWWFLAAAAAIMIGFGAIAGFEAGSDPTPTPDASAWQAAHFTGFPAQFAFLALVLIAVTADYATGGIIPTLQWTPRRTLLFFARTVVTVGTATLAGVLLAVASALAAFIAAGQVLTLPLDDGVDALATVAFVFAAGTGLAAGLGFVLRNTAGGLVAVFLLILLLPLILPQFGYDWLTTIADLLPGSRSIHLLTGEPNDRGFTTTSSVITMLTWAATLLLTGYLRLNRADANR